MAHRARGTTWQRAALVGLLLAAALRAQEGRGLDPIPRSEALEMPTQGRLASLAEACAPEGWEPAVPLLRGAALAAYSANRLDAAEAWLNAYRWAALFMEPETSFTGRWVQAVEAAHAVHANMQQRYNPQAIPLGRYLSPATQAWLLCDLRVSQEFWWNVAPVDYLPESFRILDALYQADPGRVRRYHALAVALAVVYDVPPPPTWPHVQVSAQDLPRRFPKASDAFSWWTGQDIAGRLYHPLDRLEVGELKFVVDAAAPLAQLAWSQEIVEYPLDKFERTYPMIRYRSDRSSSETYVWPDGPYTMETILARGGICIDQAYFASEAGKARGIPTILFFGAGKDGRHAWFGFLDQDDRWQFDAGRYAEQRLVTGMAIDPQTWTEVSDHEIQFLSDPFHRLPTYRESRVNQDFAWDFLSRGDPAAALRAITKATDYEPRNLEAWRGRLDLARRAHTPAGEMEAMLRFAVRAFDAYPDVAAPFERQIIDSLRARGQGSLADEEERTYMRRYQGDRSDLAIASAQVILLKSMSGQPLGEQIATYEKLLDEFGQNGGAPFFDKIVRLFVEHLAVGGERDKARAEAEKARQSMGIAEGSQLENDMNQLIARIGSV